MKECLCWKTVTQLGNKFPWRMVYDDIWVSLKKPSMPQIQSTISHRISLKVYFNIILPSSSRSSKYSPPVNCQTNLHTCLTTFMPTAKSAHSILLDWMKNIKSGVSHEASHYIIFCWLLSSPLLRWSFTLSRTTSVEALVLKPATNIHPYKAIRFEISTFLTLCLRTVFKWKIRSSPLLRWNITLSRTTSVEALVLKPATNVHTHKAIRFEISTFLTLGFRTVWSLKTHIWVVPRR